MADNVKMLSTFIVGKLGNFLLFIRHILIIRSIAQVFFAAADLVGMIASRDVDVYFVGDSVLFCVLNHKTLLLDIYYVCTHLELLLAGYTCLYVLNFCIVSIKCSDIQHRV